MQVVVAPPAPPAPVSVEDASLFFLVLALFNLCACAVCFGMRIP